MAGGDETLVAAAAFIQNLARDVPGTSTVNPFEIKSNGYDAKKVKLPGAAGPGKEALERELEALLCRVNTLQFRSVSVPIFCDPLEDRLSRLVISMARAVYR